MWTPDFVVFFDVFALAVVSGDEPFPDELVENFHSLRSQES